MKNVPAVFLHRIQTSGPAAALMFKQSGSWQTISWAQYGQAVREIARALPGLGVQPGDRVALLASTRVEWVQADVAILSACAVTVPVYPSSTAEDIHFILEHSGAKALFIESPELARKVMQGAAGGFVPPMVYFGGTPDRPGDTTLEALKAIGRGLPGDPVAESAVSLSGDATATIVYTSGTTGVPKGAELTHANMLGECVGLCDVLAVTDRSRTLSFLPLAHIFARMLHILGLYIGFLTAYAESMDKVVDNLAETRPTFLASVPRVFEKIYARVMGRLEQATSGRRRLALWALSQGRAHHAASVAPGGPSFVKGLLFGLADLIILKKIRAVFGGELNILISGGAPLPVGIAEFFASIGLPILEGYGLTETTAATHVNRPGRVRIGTVGLQIQGMETRIAEDGEIQLKGSVVMKGYYRDDVATQAALGDGWFSTGDIGVIDPDGFLRITDRKKDLIITSAGKNIAPQKIEGLIKGSSYVSQVMCYGDRKNYLAALVSINVGEFRSHFERRGIPVPPEGALATHPEVVAVIQKVFDDKNRELARYETIKKFVITEEEMTQDNGMLTPTLKLKRREIVKKYGALLESLYDEAGPVPAHAAEA